MKAQALKLTLKNSDPSVVVVVVNWGNVETYYEQTGFTIVCFSGGGFIEVEEKASMIDEQIEKFN